MHKTTKALALSLLLAGSALAQEARLQTQSPAPQRTTPPLEESIRPWLGRQAFGVYMLGNKVGHAIYEAKRVEHEGQPALLVQWEMQIAVKMFGETSEMQSIAREWYSLAGAGELRAAETVETKDGIQNRYELRNQRGEWILRKTTGERRTERKVSTPKLQLAEYARFDRWLADGPEAGAEWRLWTLDLSGSRLDVPQDIHYGKGEQTTLSGVPTLTHTMDMRYRGLEAKARIQNAMVIVEIDASPALRLLAQDERIARHPSKDAKELALEFSVPVDEDLGPLPGPIDELELRVRGLGDYVLPQNHRQRLVHDEDGELRLRVRRDFRVEKGLLLPEAEATRLRQPEPGIESDDPVLVAAARKIVGDTKEPAEVARRLQAWVHENLRASTNSDSARTIYEQRSGDCTEHARLFVAFARALGIPAREVAGLIYFREPKPAFAWHQWAEIHDGHQWVSVDPAWDQVYVDATHICFTTDIEDLGWVSVVGKVNFSVVSHRIRK